MHDLDWNMLSLDHTMNMNMDINMNVNIWICNYMRTIALYWSLMIKTEDCMFEKE